MPHTPIFPSLTQPLLPAACTAFKQPGSDLLRDPDSKLAYNLKTGELVNLESGLVLDIQSVLAPNIYGQQEGSADYLSPFLKCVKALHEQ